MFDILVKKALLMKCERSNTSLLEFCCVLPDTAFAVSSLERLLEAIDAKRVARPET